MADQLGPPAPAAGQVAGCPSALGQVAEEAEGGQGPGGAGCWAGQGEEPLSATAAGDQGGKLCSMQVHGQGEERKKTEKKWAAQVYYIRKRERTRTTAKFSILDPLPSLKCT